MKKPRKYASFYDWHDRQIKELGIVRELVQSLSAQGVSLRDPRIQEPDPPDCVCVDDAGRPIALEVVELVSQEAIERNERGEDVYRWWDSEDIRAEVEQLLARKDRKTFNGGPFAEVAVLIHTDEPALTADVTRDALAGVAYGPFKQLTRAFLMFSYMPGRGHEVLHLSVVAHNNGLHRTAVSRNEG